MKQLWNDGWSFLKGAVDTELAQVKERITEFEAVTLPHDWLIYDSHNLYEDGNGWYRKCFSWSGEGKRATIIFDGIYMDSTFYINGVCAGEWKYGYSQFVFDVTPYLKQGENEILVKVAFRSPNSRWYSGAGIYRDVWFSETETTYIKENDIYVSTQKQGDDFVLTVETVVQEAAGSEVRNRLFAPDGQEVELVQEGESYLVNAPRLWDTDTPNLYTLRTELFKDNQLIQTIEQKIGFRTTAFDSEKGFALNGRFRKLQGVCEHHDLGALGAAFDKAAMRRKFRILKEMGVNAVRGAHNMMAEGFLELADEMGILLISEAFDMWERPKTTYDYARFFREWHERDVESWVKRDRNHPSVIMWSIGNEIYDTHADEHGREITLRLKELVERYDAGRNAAVTMGSNYMPWENAQKCADVVKLAGYNYSEKYYDSHHEKYPDWVIYGSETSSIVQSRGVYHFPLRASILAEDDYQCSSLGNSATSWGAKSMEDCVTIDRDKPYSMGQFLWTGFDYIGEPTPYHTKNSYFGQVDTAGFAKDAYYVWQSAWTDYRVKPMVHVFPYWDFNEGQLIDVRVCSNAPFVELFVNGKSLGRQELTHAAGSGKHIIADYQVAYETGVVLAVAYDENGQEIAREEKKSFGNSAAIVLQAEAADGRILAESDISTDIAGTCALMRQNMKAVAETHGEATGVVETATLSLTPDSTDMLFVTIQTVDENGILVENACDRVQVEVTGAGYLAGLDNGDSTDYDSYKGVSKRLFNGKLLAMVQPDKAGSEIQIRVTAVGEEIPVRKIVLTAPQGQKFTAGQTELTVTARIEPECATDKELIFKAVNDMGVPSNLVTVEREGDTVRLTALGDGEFRLRCMSKSGTEEIRLISQLEFTIEGLGQAYQNPYDFVSGSLYTSVIGEVGNGNERGVATARDGETVVSYGNIDFGEVGSDEITVPVFALTSEEYPIKIWEGIPGEEGSVLLADVIYQVPTKWNVYQPATWKLAKRLKGIATISFQVHQKIHIKGFSFTKYEKAWMPLMAREADAVYGDSFEMTAAAVERIGNNVSLVYTNMNFDKGTDRLTIKGRAPQGENTIHVRFFNGEEEIKQIVEFGQSTEYEEQQFELEIVKGCWDVTFVFLPGSCFDFEKFVFSKSDI